VKPIAYPGEPGSFAEDAAVAAFGSEAPRVGLPAFRDVFRAVTDGVASHGVLPIENVVNGSVRETYDLLLEHELAIIAEVVVPVDLCLAALPGQTLDQIERVYSHIQAIGQAEGFLQTRPWSVLTTYNTAGAGKLIADQQERGAAAVLSARAAAAYGLEVLASSIQNVPDNRTRFVVVAPRRAAAEAKDAALTPERTTLAFGLENRPGSLLRILEVFAARGLNLSKLESRPSRTRAWEYIFWADIDAGIGSPSVDDALAELVGVTSMTRVLGSYPRAESS
jgi:prephenate dehydratase